MIHADNSVNERCFCCCWRNLFSVKLGCSHLLTNRVFVVDRTYVSWPYARACV